MMLKVDCTIDDLLDAAFEIEDSNWLRYMVSKDPLHSRFDEAFTQSVLRNACQTAEDVYRDLLNSYGRQSLLEYLNLSNVELTEVVDKAEFDYIYMSIYTQQPACITIYKSAMQVVEQVMQNSKYQQYINAEQFSQVAIGHELFHHLEFNTAGIYTQQKIFKYKTMGVINHHVALMSASEVAAINFSRLVTGISYSPLVYELIIHFANNKILAREFLDKLMSYQEKE